MVPATSLCLALLQFCLANTYSWGAPEQTPAWQGSFVQSPVEFPGRLEDFQVEDLDGDGRSELLLSGRKPDGTRGLLVLWMRIDGTFSPADAEPLPLPAGTLFWSLCDWNGDGKTDVCLLGEEGVIGYPLLEGHRFERQPTLVLKYRTELPRMEAKPGFWELARDWNGDGKPDWLLPGRLGWSFFPGEVEGAANRKPMQVLSTEAGSRGEAWGEEYRFSLPLPKAADFDGDGRPDAAFLRRDGLVLFLNRGAEGFSKQPMERDYAALLGQSTDLRPRIKSLKDLTGDKRADVLLMYRKRKPGALFGGVIWEAVLFPTGEGGVPARKPGFSVPFESVSPEFIVMDANNDGREDLITPELQLDLSVLMAFFSRKIKVPLEVRLQSSDGTFPKEPSFKYPLRMHIDDPVLATGDFDGDGLQDILVSTGKGELSLYPGIKNGFLAKEPAGTAPMPLTKGDYQLAEVKTPDINGDGKADLIWDLRQDNGEGPIGVWVSK